MSCSTRSKAGPDGQGQRRGSDSSAVWLPDALLDDGLLDFTLLSGASLATQVNTAAGVWRACGGGGRGDVVMDC